MEAGPATAVAGSTSGDPTENLKRAPAKGILKNSSSFEANEQALQRKFRQERHKSMKWDEMNILATHHPADKDYGFMKIDEPKTPYHRNLSEDEDEVDAIDPQVLADRIKSSIVDKPRKLSTSSVELPPDESDDEEETPEQKAARYDFDKKRKSHYNEFYAAKLARKLMEEEEDDDEEDGSKDNSTKSADPTEDITEDIDDDSKPSTSS